jgi:hypothetical protein
LSVSDPFFALGTRLAEALVIMKTIALTSLAALSILGGFVTGCSAGGDEDVAAADSHIEGNTLVYKHDDAVRLAPTGGLEADKLLVKLFPEGYRKSETECETQLPDARIVPTVSGKLTGSFTGPYRREALYVVSVYGCDASHAEGYGTTRFVVVDPAVTSEVRILANAEEQGVDAGINRLLDLDQDGQNEIVLTHGWVGQGYTIESAELVRVAGNSLASDAAFKAFSDTLSTPDQESPFYSDSCGTGTDPMNVAFANIYGTFSNGRLTFKDQKGTMACPPENGANQ